MQFGKPLTCPARFQSWPGVCSATEHCPSGVRVYQADWSVGKIVSDLAEALEADHVNRESAWVRMLCWGNGVNANANKLDTPPQKESTVALWARDSFHIRIPLIVYLISISIS